MDYIYEIKEYTFDSDREEDEMTEALLARGTDYDVGYRKIREYFEENKPDDEAYNIIIDDYDQIIAEKYDEKTQRVEQYIVTIEKVKLSF